MLVVRQAFRRIDRRVAELGQLVELLIAVAEGVETGVAGPEDAEPVLRVGIVLIPAAEVDKLRVRRRILAQGRECRSLHRFNGELDAQDVADLSGNPLGMLAPLLIVAVEVELDLRQVVRTAIRRFGQRLPGGLGIERVLIRVDGAGQPSGMKETVGRQSPERSSVQRVSRSMAYANASRTFLSWNGSW